MNTRPTGYCQISKTKERSQFGKTISHQTKLMNAAERVNIPAYMRAYQGRRPRGTVPPKFEVRGRPMHWSPQYFEK